jgi:hypothetical protein
VKKFAALKSNEPVNPAVPADNDVDITLPCAEPVTINEPDIIAEPVNGNDAPPPPAFNANDAVIANDDVVAKDALATLPLKNEAVAAKLAVVANDDVVAKDALVTLPLKKEAVDAKLALIAVVATLALVAKLADTTFDELPLIT